MRYIDLVFDSLEKLCLKLYEIERTTISLQELFMFMFLYGDFKTAIKHLKEYKGEAFNENRIST